MDSIQERDYKNHYSRLYDFAMTFKNFQGSLLINRVIKNLLINFFNDVIAAKHNTYMYICTHIYTCIHL